jgi:hypothetical protein
MIHAIHRSLTIVCAAALTAAVMPVDAQQLAPGNYVSEGGWGEMKVDAAGKFKIQSMGANGHTCEVEGTLSGRKGRATQQAGEAVCEIAVVPKRDHWSVEIPTAYHEACRAHCGMRAVFDGKYLREVPRCRGEVVKKDRATFDRQYKAGEFQAAAATLEAVFAECGKFLYWTTELDLRNDMAIAHHRAKDDAACLRALQPVARHYVSDPPGVTFTPIDAEWGEKAVRKTRFNWKACGGTAAKAR